MDNIFKLSETQQNRLSELGADVEQTPVFSTSSERDKYFQETEKRLSRENKTRLLDLLNTKHRPELCALEYTLSDALCKLGFTQVTTPIIISDKFLERMSIDGSHPLSGQVFRVDKNKCLRPMLAPNLYSVSKDLLKITAGKPLRIFEIGSCFRRETEGRSHLKEFTMLNLVEWGLPENERAEHLKQFGRAVLSAVGIDEYDMISENSVVYGEGLDFVGRDGLELASTSMGSHPLDARWGINSTWVGIGFGLERLLMYRENSHGIHRFSKSIAFLDGARLNVK